MSYNLKPALSFEEQITRLKSRNMIIEDEDEAKAALSRLNYYRFSGYAFLFQRPDDQYNDGTSFRHIIRLMDFDSDLRRILLMYLEYIEILSRTQIAHWFSIYHNMDGGAHYDPALFVNAEYHQKYIKNLEDQITKNKNQPFVKHHINSFHGKMPLWSAVEILSFSMLSKLYSNMMPADKSLIASKMNTAPDYLSNWLHCFSVLRNTCAHYNRLYHNVCNPRVSLNQKLLRSHPEIKLNTLFAYVIAMLRFIPDETLKCSFVSALGHLFDNYRDTVDLSCIGFPDNWHGLLTNEEIINLKPKSTAE